MPDEIDIPPKPNVAKASVFFHILEVEAVALAGLTTRVTFAVVPGREAPGMDDTPTRRWLLRL